MNSTEIAERALTHIETTVLNLQKAILRSDQQITDGNDTLTLMNEQQKKMLQVWEHMYVQLSIVGRSKVDEDLKKLKQFELSIRSLQEITVVQCKESHVDDYMLGLANGLILATSIFTGQEPQFVTRRKSDEAEARSN